jgi:DNA-binding beta-propeller fold protein YncE
MMIKFNPEGRVVMVFGRKKEASDEGAEAWKHPRPPLPPVDGQFRQPTDVTWDTQGNIFLNDGYINSRIAKYDKDGHWVTSFGEPGSGPGQLNTPHSIAADAKGNIYVADRGNRRIQVFDPDGKLEREIRIDVPVPPDARTWQGAKPAQGPGQPGTMQSGSPWAICITPGPTQYLYSADAFPGRVYKLSLDGKVLGWLGSTGRQPKEFGWIHEIACPAENTIYVAEILNWRLQKLILHPEKAALGQSAKK